MGAHFRRLKPSGNQNATAPQVAQSLAGWSPEIGKTTGGCNLLEHDHVFRPLVGQRREQHAVEHGEHCGIRADSERQDGDRRSGEAGALYKGAEGEAEIVH